MRKCAVVRQKRAHTSVSYKVQGSTPIFLTNAGPGSRPALKHHSSAWVCTL